MKKQGKVTARIVATLNSLIRLPRFLNDPAIAHTYYPAEPKKSRLAIWTDNIIWVFKNAEVNRNYFIYGLDRKNGVGADEFMAIRQGQDLIQRSNSRAWSGPRTTDYRCLCKDKFVFGSLLKSLSIPTPKNFALYYGSRLFWLDQGTVKGLDSLLETEGLDVFCKDAIGFRGQNVFPLKIENGKLFTDGTEISLDDLHKRMPVIAILQERLIQHPHVDRIFSHCINTIRLVTFMEKGEVSPFRAFMRFGAGRSRVDNWASGGVAVPIDLETGRLTERGVVKPGKKGFTQTHPTTEYKFKDFEVPHFKEAVETAIRLHRFFYGFASIGWDIGITPKGPVFIEGNHLWEIGSMQAIVGGVKDEFLQAISNAGPF